MINFKLDDSAKSISVKLLEAENRPTGFDYLRVILAILIMCFHSIVIGYGDIVQNNILLSSSFRPLILIIVPMFFALSGFLVAGSLERTNSVITFLGLRVIRIFPALTVDTLFSAIFVGGIFTSLKLVDYFSNQEFISYFGNVIGDIHYTLPGVFSDNPSHLVNGQLWTIPIELECYIAIAALSIIRLHKNRRIFLVMIFAIPAAVAVWHIWVVPPADANGKKLILMSFLFGIGMYLFRDKMPHRIIYFLIASMLSVYLLSLRPLSTFAAAPISYVTIYLGTLNPKKISILKLGDYSYGLYLYGYPIQQAIVTILPLAKVWWLDITLSVPTALVFAAMSWHFVEKRALNLRRYVYKLGSFRAGQ